MSTQRRENRWRRTGCTGRARASEKVFPQLHSALRRCRRQRWNGPAGFRLGSTPATKIVAGARWLATNSLHLGYRIVQLVRQELRHGSPPFGAGPGAAVGAPAIHGSSLSHILLPFRSTRTFPSNLAAGPGRQTPPGGKVRWQKRFAFPVRRTKRDWQFLKTINSRKSTTNAKTSTPWPGRFTTVASPASCQACSRPLWT